MQEVYYGVKINRFNSSFPVGKIRMEHMYPMNFEEFLMATGKDMLLEKIKESYSNMKPMPQFAHEQALTLYRQYLCVGGMPESLIQDLKRNTACHRRKRREAGETVRWTVSLLRRESLHRR